MTLEISQLSPNKLRLLLKPCINWCSDRLAGPIVNQSISTAFRSQSLALAAQSVFPDSCHTTFDHNLEKRFEAFLTERKSLLSTSHFDDDDVASEVNREKSLLITDWSKSLFDGAVAPETEGFIDEDCMPPWDTWVALVKTRNSFGTACLLSWVPIWLSDKVDFGIQVDAAECLSWLELGNGSIPRLTGWGSKWAA